MSTLDWLTAPLVETGSPLGQARFDAVNALMAETFAKHRPVIVAHRGVATGMIPENTVAAAQAAFHSGADMVEVDVIASRDGEYFAFHTGTEPENLGIATPLESLSATDIQSLAYRNTGRRGRVRRVERLRDLLERFRGGYLFNIDRSWSYWPDLLDRLVELGMTGQLLLKCPANEEEALDALRAHPEPFPFMMICHSSEDVERALSDPLLNLVGIELIADSTEHALHDPDVNDDIHDRGVFTFANAEMLGDHGDLFAGFDDEASVELGPEFGWGMLMGMGFRAIQTDWPWLLRDFRDRALTCR